MKKEYKLWLWIILWFFILLIIFYSIWKKDQNDKLKELWISNEQAKEIKKDVETLNKKYSNESVSSAEDIFLTSNWLKKDSNGLYYTYDKYQFDSKMIYFKKEDWKWMWSILLWNWDNIDDYKYDNSNSIYNGYEIKQDKNKKIFDELNKF